MFRRDIERTPKQKAERAMMNIFARLAGCAFLIYFLVQLLTMPEADRPGEGTTIIISTILVVLAIAVILMTVIDLISGIKKGRFKAATYEEAGLSDDPDSSIGEIADTEEPDALEDGDGDDNEVSEDTDESVDDPDTEK